MADLKIDSGDISKAIDRVLADFKPKVEKEEVGLITYAGDGIVRVSGLAGTMANELLEFPGDLIGLAMNLEPELIGVVVLGDASSLKEGMPVKRTGTVLSVPVGDAFLGRVIDPLCRPLDGKGPIDDSKVAGVRPLEVQAPSVIDRQPVGEPLETGIKAIDSLIPIGKGQRQLIIGDRQTGKTAICIDTIINQKQYWGSPKQVKCVYVAIGQKASTVSEVVNALDESGALEYTVVMSADAEDPAALKFLAPYAGCALGQYWMYEGEHSLIIYDDLSKQAESYRQISLLLRRPAGREAYPGDIFYLHSRLLERSAKLSEEKGSGSLTALPIIETKEGDSTAYIPTNVWSITDGQIILDKDLFNRLQRPAVDIGLSVSRVGGAAQIDAMDDAAGPLKLELAQYRDLAAFAAFAADLDKASQAQLAKGDRLMEMMKQPQFSPVPVERQVVSIFSATQGYLEDISLTDIRRFERELLEYVERNHPDVLDHFKINGDFPEDVNEKLRKAILEFKATFVHSEPEASEKKEAAVEVVDTEDAVSGAEYT